MYLQIPSLPITPSDTGIRTHDLAASQSQSSDANRSAILPPKYQNRPSASIEYNKLFGGKCSAPDTVLSQSLRLHSWCREGLLHPFQKFHPNLVTDLGSFLTAQTMVVNALFLHQCSKN